MNSEIIQNVTYDNYDNFQHVNFLFSRQKNKNWSKSLGSANPFMGGFNVHRNILL
jgi:hypothetical protein